ncbi:MAG TPA: MerR family transcriptional regulator, partial [Paracoccus sp.]|nr:MerR family transcriptional regulator [Paracoccus sp. (in: a-proteobacteria)]
MKKAPEAFRTISEVSDILDTPAHVLRFWESKFYQIRPVKRAGGRRYYRPDDLALLAGIRLLLQDHGMTIRGVQKILQEQGVKHVSSLAVGVAAEAPETGQAEAEGAPGEQRGDHATPSGRTGSAPPPLRVMPAR